MPALQVESFDQDLRILLIGEDVLLTKLLTNHLLQQQVGVDRIPLHSVDVDEFATQKLEESSYIKIVVTANFRDPANPTSPELFKLIELIKNSGLPTILLSRHFREIDECDPLLESWRFWSSQSRDFVDLFRKDNPRAKVLLAQDVVSDVEVGVEKCPPFYHLFQAVGNGYLLDPQLELFPTTQATFFNTIKKEILRPDSRSYLVKGVAISTEELLLKFASSYSKIYGNKLFSLNPKLTQATTAEPEELITEVVIPFDLHNYLKSTLESINIGHLSVEPQQLTPLIDQKPLLLTTPSKPFKNKGVDFKFEPSIKVSPTVVGGPQQSEETDQETKSYSRPLLKKKPNSNNSPPPPIVIVEEKPRATHNPEAFNTEQDELDESLGRLFIEKRTKQKVERRSKKAGVFSKIKRKSKNKRIIFIAGLVVVVIGGAVGVSLASLALNFRAAQAKTQENITAFVNKKNNEVSRLTLLGWQANLLDKLFSLQLVEGSAQLYLFNNNLVELAEARQSHQTLSAEIMSQVLSITPQGSAQLLEKSELIGLLESHQEQTERLRENILINKSKIEEQHPGIFSEELQASISLFVDDLKKTSTRLQASSQLSVFLKKILAIDGKKSYFIFLQDPQELRPTGGFIQAVAHLLFEDGRLVDYQVYSTNWLDSQVMGEVPASAEIEQLLGESSLKFRDSNWNPDLSSSANQASWFLREALNQPVDGILSMNYHQVREALLLFEQLEIENYQETLTAQNLFSRLEQKAAEDRDFSKESFHTAVLLSFLERLKSSSHEELTKIQDLLFNELKSQQMSLYFSDETINSQMRQLGWGGSLLQPDCPARFSQDCAVDYLYQVDANVGVNKVNRYVSSRVNHSIEIMEDRVVHERRTTYKNQSHSSVWPLGDYKNYVRFYLDSDALVEKVTINGGVVANEAIRRLKEHNRQVVGVLATIPPGEELELQISFATPRTIGEGGSYFFFEQPQPGVNKRLSSINVTHPADLKAELISPLVEVNQNKIIVTSDLVTGFVAIKFE